MKKGVPGLPVRKIGYGKQFDVKPSSMISPVWSTEMAYLFSLPSDGSVPSMQKVTFERVSSRSVTPVPNALKRTRSKFPTHDPAELSYAWTVRWILVGSENVRGETGNVVNGRLASVPHVQYIL